MVSYIVKMPIAKAGWKDQLGRERKRIARLPWRTSIIISSTVKLDMMLLILIRFGSLLLLLTLKFSGGNYHGDGSHVSELYLIEVRCIPISVFETYARIELKISIMLS